MSSERSRPWRNGRLPITAIILSLLATGSPAAGAEGGRVELFHGPDETGTMSLKKLRMILDGKDLEIPVPAEAKKTD